LKSSKQTIYKTTQNKQYIEQHKNTLKSSKQTTHRTTQNKQYIEQNKITYKSSKQTIHRTTQKIHRPAQKLGRLRAVPRLCGFYPGICFTTEEKARKTSDDEKGVLNLANCQHFANFLRNSKTSSQHTTLY